MPNRFDHPAQAQFVNTYVGLPLEELKQAGLARQQRHDENLASLDAAQMAADNLQAIPNSVDAQYIKQVRNRIQDLSTQFVDKDLSDPEVYRDLQRQMRGSIDQARVRDIQESFSGYSNYQTQLAKLESQRKGTPQALRQDFDLYDTAKSGIFTDLPKAAQDRKAETTRFFDQMQDEFLGQVQLSDGVRGLEHGVTEQRATEHALNNWKVFGSSPAGQEILEEAAALGDTRNAKDILTEYLLAEAPEHTRSRVTGTYRTEGFDKEPTEPKLPILTSPGPGLTRAGIEKANKNTPDVKELIPGYRGHKKGAFKSAWDFVATKAGEEEEFNPFETPEAEAEFNKYGSAAANYYGISDFANLPLKDQEKEINNYIKQKYQEGTSPNVREYTTAKMVTSEQDKIAELGEGFTASNRMVYDVNKPIGQELMNGEDLAREYPLGEYKWKIIGRTNDIPNMGEALQLTILDAETGSPVEGAQYFIGAANEYQAAGRFYNDFSTNLMYSVLPEGNFQTYDNNGIRYDVKYKTLEGKALEDAKKQNPDISKYNAIVTLPDGNSIQGAGDTMSQLMMTLQNSANDLDNILLNN